jgi:lipopolysaccharide O-acetyltransferase
MKNIIDNYGISGTLRLIYYKLYTFLFFNKSRLIRLPIIVRGKKYIDFGSRLTIGVGCRIEAFKNDNSPKSLIFGRNVKLNDYVHITAMNKVIIGNNVLMASKIYISDCSHGFYSGTGEQSSPEQIPDERKLYKSEVIIEDNVWLGEFVSVLPDVRIGKGSIIGSNSVVSKDIPPNSIAVGSPAQVIKKFNDKLRIWEKVKTS